MDEDDETGYILAAIRHRETFTQSNDWHVVHVLVDNSAGEHVCSPRDFEWIAIEPSRNPHLVSASGNKLKHYGEQAVPMKLRDGRKIWITFQVCEVNWPTMSVGKFLYQGKRSVRHVHDTWWCLVARRSWRDCGGQSSKPPRAGKLDQTRKRVGSSASWPAPVEPAEHRATVSQRTDDEILMHVRPQGAHASRADEEYIEPEILLEILLVASLPGPRERSKDEIEKTQSTA